jgi:hypothetical protein
MRSVKIWGGGMAGLLGGFVVVLLLLREVVIRDETSRVSPDIAVWALLVITVPVVLGPVLGACLAARLTRPARHDDSPSGHGLADPGLSRRGETFGEWSGMAVLLGGVAVDDEGVWELARLVDKPLSQKLEAALRLRSSVVSVSPEEQKAILHALENAPDTLHGVRELLLTDETWRRSESLCGTAERDPAAVSAGS